MFGLKHLQRETLVAWLVTAERYEIPIYLYNMAFQNLDSEPWDARERAEVVCWIARDLTRNNLVQREPSARTDNE